MAVSSAALTPVSYVVLGLLERLGPSTPYDLKQFVARSIGYFWSFPHSQLYAEPRRLAAAGFIDERLEAGGRRRRTYTITDAGRAALRRWLREPTTALPELRDLGMLKLFFGDIVSSEAVVSLARAQEEAHRRRLATYRAIEDKLAALPGRAHALATLRMGIVQERAFLRFWQEIAERPPAL